MSNTYFLLNDTRFDNHHGCVTVIYNLHQAMQTRGWHCIGSLPVSSKLADLANFFPSGSKPDLIIVNGEGTLHHNKRKSRNLLAICSELQKHYPVVLINALWQDNDINHHKETLMAFKAIYVRDKRSLKQLMDAGITAKYAPDLTFYNYPRFTREPIQNLYACTDSVKNNWSVRAQNFCRGHSNIDYLTMFTGTITYKRGIKDKIKSLKNRFYPFLHQHLYLKVPPRYRQLATAATKDTELFLQQLQQYEAICVARYHALCFVLQQNIPFLVVSSNSHKSEALLEEVGLPVTDFILDEGDLYLLPQKLVHVAENTSLYQPKIERFCEEAIVLINLMFDDITDKEARIHC